MDPEPTINHPPPVRSEGYKPYHEVQAVFTGAPVRTLLDLFGQRWAHATGEEVR